LLKPAQLAFKKWPHTLATRSVSLVVADPKPLPVGQVPGFHVFAGKV